MNDHDVIKAAIAELRYIVFNDSATPPSIYVSDHDYVKISLSGIDMTNVFVFGNPTKYKTNER